MKNQLMKQQIKIIRKQMVRNQIISAAERKLPKTCHKYLEGISKILVK